MRTERTRAGQDRRRDFKTASTLEWLGAKDRRSGKDRRRLLTRDNIAEVLDRLIGEFYD